MNHSIVFISVAVNYCGRVMGDSRGHRFRQRFRAQGEASDRECARTPLKCVALVEGL
jgi:hypothetical protein